MSLKLLVKKLAISNKKFITSEDIKTDCRNLSLAYLTAIKYLLSNKYLARTFRGIFYVYSMEERKLGKSEMSFYDILKEAFKIKGIKNWYFGLETALKINNLTHEYFTVDYIINDKVFRAKPIKIMGREVKFYKLNPKLVAFGVIRRKLMHSDPEKTLLDMLYLKHYSIPEFKEIAKKLSKTKLVRYSKRYSNNIIKIVYELQ